MGEYKNDCEFSNIVNAFKQLCKQLNSHTDILMAMYMALSRLNDHLFFARHVKSLNKLCGIYDEWSCNQ